jgi:hypothetical protein
MSQITLRRTALHVGLLQIAIIILVLATALIHLDKAAIGFFGHAGGAAAGSHPAGGGSPPSLKSLIFQNLTLLFFLNFIGYIVLGVALYLPFLKRFQRIIRWLLIVFAAITIIGYFALLHFTPNPVGYIDKAIEVVLVVLLLIEDFKFARPAAAKE